MLELLQSPDSFVAIGTMLAGSAAISGAFSGHNGELKYVEESKKNGRPTVILPSG